ncbi:MAG: hypothetical protein FWH53_06360 [Leptospirales bacterium]|nr:hypothetical protein [Leptospirales bacterium]
MTSKHLNFEELSDLIDNILVDEEREYCLTHISQCKECGEEYESLLRYKSLLSSLDKENLAFPDFSHSTIVIYKRREKKKLLMKVVPAIAASVIIVMGIGFVKNGSFNTSSSNLAVNLTDQKDMQRIVEYISSHKGKIVQTNNSYIDTEFDNDMLADLEEVLDKDNIQHAIIINPLEKNIDDITLVVTKKININNLNSSNYPSLANKKIQIRIFK